jgi:hypothetical protein
MSTHPYEYMRIHPTPINTFKNRTPISTSVRLSQFDLEIHEVGYQERLIVNGDVPPTKRIINHKCNTHVKSEI